MTRQERIWVWLLAALTVVLQLWLTQFFSFGTNVVFSGDWNLGNLSLLGQTFPPRSYYDRFYWLGMPAVPGTPSPMVWWGLLSPWLVATTWYPVCSGFALLGFHHFIRRMGFRLGPSLFGAVAYAWQGQLLSNLCPGHFAPGLILAALPWAAWAIRRAVLEVRWSLAIWGGIFTGWMVAALADRGALSSVLVGLVGLGTLVESFGEEKRLRRLLIILTLIAVAFGVAYPSLRSTLNYAIGESVVEQKSRPEQYDWATQWSFPPEETLTFLVPGFFGWRTGAAQGAYWGRVGQSPGWPKEGNLMNYHLESTTLGTVAGVLVLVAMLAFFRAPLILSLQGEASAKRVKNWLALFQIGFGVCLLLGFGRFTPVHRWFYELPFMDQWRNPNKFLTAGTFCFAVLASYGAAVIEAGLKGGDDSYLRRLLRHTLGGCGLGLLGVLLFFITLGWAMSALLISQGMVFSTVQSSLGTTKACLFLALVICLGLWGGLGLFFAHEREAARVLPNPWIQNTWNRAMRPEDVGFSACLFLIGLTVAQMFWVHGHFLQPTPARAPAHDALLDPLRPGFGKERVALIPGDPFLQHYLTLEFPRAGITSIDIPAASRQPEDYRQLFSAFKDDRNRLWQMAGVRWVAASREAWSRTKSRFKPEEIKAENWMHIEGNRLGSLRFVAEPNEAQATHVLVELTQWQPKAAVYFEALPVASRDGVYPKIIEPAFNPARTVALQKLGLPPLSKTGRAQVDLSVYTDHLVRVSLNATAPGVLVVNDRFDPDWKVTINGNPATLEWANGIFCAVRVPEGASDVVLRYQPEVRPVWFVWGFYVFVGSWSVVYAMQPRKRSHTA